MDEKLESLKETDLYDAVSGFLRRLGYEVQAEVDHCDVAARKEDHIILIEMKLNLSVRVADTSGFAAENRRGCLYCRAKTQEF